MEPHRTITDGENPPSYLSHAVILTLLCFPTAIISVRESIYCEKFKNEGNLELARKASLKAKKWLWYSFWLGILSLALLGLVAYLLWPIMEQGAETLMQIMAERP